MGFLERLLSGGHSGYKSHGGGHHGRGHDGYSSDRRDEQQQRPVVLCAGCNARNNADARFCEQCGKSMLATVCPHCSAAVAANSQFCSQCGKTAR